MSVIRKAAAFRTNRVAGCSWHQRDTAWCDPWLGIYYAMYFGIPILSDSPASAQHPVWATLDRPWVHRWPNLTTGPGVLAPGGSERSSSGLWAGVTLHLRAQARASVVSTRKHHSQTWDQDVLERPVSPSPLLALPLPHQMSHMILQTHHISYALLFKSGPKQSPGSSYTGKAATNEKWEIVFENGQNQG